VPFSELLRQPAETTNRLTRARAVRLRRRDAADLVLMFAPPTKRQHPLKGSLSTDLYGGTRLAQWQYEGHRRWPVWYLVDHETRTCWIKHAGTGHPHQTD